MEEQGLIGMVRRQDWLDDAADAVQPAVRRTFAAGGEAGRKAKNFLHGTWLGHQLHPVVTDVPVGAWTVAAVLDGLELAGAHKFAAGADAAVAIGLMHGLLNTAAAALYAGSLVCRRRDSRTAGIGLSMLGFAVAGAAAYLGGHLVYNERVGPTNAVGAGAAPADFTDVIGDEELGEGEMKCVEAGGANVLIARSGGQVYALLNECSHLGGPLADGELSADGAVRCPWHGSRFALATGEALDGPATSPQPCFVVRVANGRIQIRKNKEE